MYIIIVTILIIVCLLIFYQDFRNREVMLILFPVLFILLFLISLEIYSFKEILLQKTIINFLIFIITASAITLYFSLKGRSFKTIRQEMIGLGDILFLLAITPLFDPVSYCFFIIIGSSFSLLFKIGLEYFKKENHKTIPFAGNLALILAILILIQRIGIIPEINIYAFI